MAIDRHPPLESAHRRTHAGHRAALRLVPTGTKGCPPSSLRHRKQTFLALRGALIVAGWAAFCAQWLHGLGPVRPILIFGFVLVVPGAAVVLRLPLVSRVEQAALTIGISAAIAMPVSEAFAFAHIWSPAAVIATLAAITTMLVVARRPRRAAPRPEWHPLHGPYPLPTTLTSRP